MRFIADFHLHSKYSRATSPQMDLENLDRWAKIKGIKILGTGDFTHPLWFDNLKRKLEPVEPGLFKLRNSDSGVRFILTAEISSIYSKGGRGRRIHNLIFAPNNATTWGLAAHYVEEALGWWEPRIEVAEIEPKPDPVDNSRLLIHIIYRIKATNDARNITYPFYLLSGGR